VSYTHRTLENMVRQTKHTYRSQLEVAKLMAARMSRNSNTNVSRTSLRPSQAFTTHHLGDNGHEILQLKKKKFNPKSEFAETKEETLSREKKLEILLGVNEQSYRWLEHEFVDTKRAQLVAEQITKELLEASDICHSQNPEKVALATNVDTSPSHLSSIQIQSFSNRKGEAARIEELRSQYFIPGTKNARPLVGGFAAAAYDFIEFENEESNRMKHTSIRQNDEADQKRNQELYLTPIRLVGDYALSLDPPLLRRKNNRVRDKYEITKRNGGIIHPITSLLIPSLTSSSDDQSISALSARKPLPMRRRLARRNE